jgi:hypothetical protein
MFQPLAGCAADGVDRVEYVESFLSQTESELRRRSAPAKKEQENICRTAELLCADDLPLFAIVNSEHYHLLKSISTETMLTSSRLALSSLKTTVLRRLAPATSLQS